MKAINEDYFLKNQGEFSRKSRVHECELTRCDCWKIIVKHDETGRLFEYYEEDNYDSIKDQAELSNDDIGFNEIDEEE